jgi:uncharacterized protein (TIGR02246 family)
MNCMATRLTVLVVVLLATAQGWAEQPKVDPADVKALREAHRGFVAAINKRDAQAVAAFYAPDADRVAPTGEIAKGRAEIQKTYANFFAQIKGAKLKSSFDSVRFISPEVAIADGSAALTPAREGGPSKVHTTVVYVKRDGKWLIAANRVMVPLQESKR